MLNHLDTSLDVEETDDSLTNLDWLHTASGSAAVQARRVEEITRLACHNACGASALLERLHSGLFKNLLADQFGTGGPWCLLMVALHEPALVTTIEFLRTKHPHQAQNYMPLNTVMWDLVLQAKIISVHKIDILSSRWRVRPWSDNLTTALEPWLSRATPLLLIGESLYSPYVNISLLFSSSDTHNLRGETSRSISLSILPVGRNPSTNALHAVFKRCSVATNKNNNTLVFDLKERIQVVDGQEVRYSCSKLLLHVVFIQHILSIKLCQEKESLFTFDGAQFQFLQPASGVCEE